MKYNKRDYLSKENTTCLRGICATLIVLGHIDALIRFLSPQILAAGLSRLLFLCVAVFFFLSGYGLAASVSSIGDKYIDNFWRHRLLPFYCKCIFLIFLYTIFDYCIGEKPTFIHIMQSFLFGRTVISKGWYLQVIIILYLLFWIVFKFTSKKKLNIFIGLIGYTIICRYLNLSTTWYETVFAFWLGFIWFDNRKFIEQKTDKTSQWICLTGIIGFLFVVVFIFAYWIKLVEEIRLLCKMLSSVIFVITILMILMKIPITNKLFYLLGQYSFEIYVLHGAFLELYIKLDVKSDLLYIFLVFLSTGVGALLLKKIFNLINKWLKMKVLVAR